MVIKPIVDDITLLALLFEDQRGLAIGIHKTGAALYESRH
jgi:hypothetical protein